MESRQQKLFFQARENVAASFAVLGDDKKRKSYLNAARKLGSDTHNLGLLQALAFLISRGDEPEKRLANDLAVSLGFVARAQTQHREAQTASEVWLDHLIECSVLEYADAKRRLLEGVLVAYVRLAQVRVKGDN